MYVLKKYIMYLLGDLEVQVGLVGQVVPEIYKKRGVFFCFYFSLTEQVKILEAILFAQKHI